MSAELSEVTIHPDPRAHPNPPRPATLVPAQWIIRPIATGYLIVTEGMYGARISEHACADVGGVVIQINHLLRRGV